MQDQVLKALKAVQDPDLHRDIVDLGFVKDVKACDGLVAFTIELTTPACPVREQMKEQAHRAVMAIPGVKQVDIKMTSQVRASKSDQKDKMVPLVKNIVPVASGKGGVGKSTVSANLAVALSMMGAKVGLMDMDVFGPSIPLLTGAVPASGGNPNRFVPPIAHGVKVVSMGFFINPGDAVIWRGPMLDKAVKQFLGQVDWGELDYLVVDLPPGTGDIQLSLCQTIPLTGAAVVSTPQDAALQVAEKAIIMFNKLNTPVLGIVENMSGYVCSHCGNKEDVFGVGGAQRYATEHGIPFLGAVPLSIDIRETSDSGQPIVISHPDSPSAKAFMKIAENLAAQISIRTANMGADNRPIPSKIELRSRQQLAIQWSDGKETLLNCYDLRVQCPCAQCVDEMTGERRLNPAAIAKDVWPQNIAPVGRYALHFDWSDGHKSGIYTFEHLRKSAGL